VLSVIVSTPKAIWTSFTAYRRDDLGDSRIPH
jgi:hypothetical protein